MILFWAPLYIILFQNDFLGMSNTVVLKKESKWHDLWSKWPIYDLVFYNIKMPPCSDPLGYTLPLTGALKWGTAWTSTSTWAVCILRKSEGVNESSEGGWKVQERLKTPLCNLQTAPYWSDLFAFNPFHIVSPIDTFTWSFPYFDHQNICQWYQLQWCPYEIQKSRFYILNDLNYRGPSTF